MLSAATEPGLDWEMGRRTALHAKTTLLEVCADSNIPAFSYLTGGWICQVDSYKLVFVSAHVKNVSENDLV